MEKETDLTPQQTAFLDALFEPDVLGDVRKAASKAGYSRPDKNAQRVARALKDQIIKRTKEFLALNAPKAALTFPNTLDGTPAPGTKEKLVAAREILDRCGVSKTEEVKVDAPTALFILPQKQAVEPEDGS